MKRLWVGIAALGAITLLVLTATSQPPDGRRDGPPPGGPGGPPGGPPPFGGPGGPPPRFEPGRVLPPHFRAELKLTEEQQKKLNELEKEVKERLLKILTAEQKKKLEQMRQRGPGGPPPDGPPPGRRDRPGQPPRGDGPPDQPDRPEKVEGARTDAQPAGIQWFATWETGLREARRTGRPILLVSAAPHCAGVPGIW